MFNSTRARACIRKLIGWKNHYNLSDIPALNPDLNISETGEYYQEKHPALALDTIKATLKSDRDLSEYLAETIDSSITEMLNDITEEKKIQMVGKEVLANDVIWGNGGWIDNTIINESRFVGVRFLPNLSIGLKAQINRLALQMTNAQTDLTIYLYHSNKRQPIATYLYTTTVGGQFNWKEVNWQLKADDEDLSGGEFFVGYYQDDISGNAIKYEKLNWNTGMCKVCNGVNKEDTYSGLTSYVRMRSFYVPNASLDPSRDMFNPEAAINSDENNWGFNFNISALCDLTNFWCDNRRSLKVLLELKVVYKILRDIQFSKEINYVEERIKNLVIRDLEGDTQTRLRSVPSRYKDALKSTRLNSGGINSTCLPPSINSHVEYSAH